MKENWVKTDKTCPKCGSKDFHIIEVWKYHTISWECIGGNFDRNDGSLEIGDAYKVQATCSKCKHSWTFKKALQIDDIITDKPLTG